MITHISYKLYNPCRPIHTRMLLFTFLHLALCSRNSEHAIYFFLIHHCTNSLSSLHIFVHHYTFCASLHTKTSGIESALVTLLRRVFCAFNRCIDTSTYMAVHCASEN